VSHISADGKTRETIKQTGRPNGLAVDSGGIIWVAESKRPSLLRLTMDGKSEVVATACDGEEFMFPNDLCFGPDGALYLTDSGVHIGEFAPDNQIRPDYMQLNYDGRVYRIEVGSGKVEKLDTGIKFTNGIAFGPDLRLYANESVTGDIFVYELQGKDAFARRLFGNVRNPAGPPGWRGPDGMAFSADGELYVAVFGQQDITVLAANGKLARRIPTRGKLPTNVAFALPGQKRLHITEYEYGHMETISVPADGLALWDGQPQSSGVVRS
jgi:gluconolactonase